MSNEKTEEKIETPAQEEKAEKIVIREGEFESLLVGCVWDILKRMRQVSMGEMTSEHATEYDDVVARHLARSLMGENDGFEMRLPYVGTALVEMLQKEHAAYYGRDALPKDIDRDNPRSVLVFVCRDFVRAVYSMVQEVGKRDDLSAKVLETEVCGLAAYWMNRFLGRKADKLN